MRLLRVKVPGALLGLLITAVTAFAFWTAVPTPSSGAANVATLNPPTGVSASATGGTVAVAWTASATSADAVTPVGYYVTRASTSAPGTMVPACGSGPAAADLLHAVTCNDLSVADGTYTYVVTAVYHSWTAASQPSGPVTVDTTPPTVSVARAGGQAATTNAQPLNYTITLSEAAATDLTAGDVTVSAPIGNGIPVTGLTKNTPTTYTLAVSGLKTDGTGDGNVGVSVTAAKFTDAAGNANTASNTATVTWDRTAPAPTITSPTSNAVVLDSPTSAITGTAGVATGDSSTVTVLIKVAGTTTQTFNNVAVSGGTWSVSPAALTRGTTYTAQVTQTDTAGNSASSTVTFRASSVLMTGPTNIINGSTNTVTPTFSGTTSNSANTVTVNVYNGTGTSSLLRSFNATTNTGGVSPFSWSGSYPTNGGQMAVGSTYTVQVSQVISGVTYTSAAYTFTVDQTAPAAPVITSPASGSFNTTGSVTLSGTAEAGSSVQVFEGATPRGTAVIATGGNWSVALTGVAQGSHTYTARATDVAGNQSAASTGVTVTVDTTSPTVSSIARVGNASTNATSVSWTVTFSETVTGVNAPDFSLAASGVSGASITSVTGSGATRTVTVNAGSGDGTLGLNLVDDDTILDSAGNTLGGAGTGNGNFTGQAFTIDRTAPAAPAITDPVNNSFKTSTSFSVSGTAEPGATVAVLDAGTQVGTTVTADAITGQWTKALTGVSQATHTYTARATDAAGNQSAASSSVAVTVDAVAPAVAITSPTSTTRTNNATPTITGTAGNATTPSADSATVTVKIYAGSTATGTPAQTLSASRSATTWSIAANSLTDGTYTVQASQTDAAGNTGTSTAVTFVVDLIAPTATAFSSANKGGGQSTAGKLEKGDSFTLTFSEQMSPQSILAGWTGTVQTGSVVVRLTDNGTNDLLTIFDSTNTTQVNLGSIALGANYTTSNITFGQSNGASTLTQSGATITVALGGETGTLTGLQTVASSTVIWTPSTAATDLAGNALTAGTVSKTAQQF